MAVTGEKTLGFATVLDNSGLLTGSAQAQGIISKMASNIARINPFVGLGVAATAAFAIISKGAYDLAKDFEHAMREVQTISQATQDNFDQISKDVFSLSKVSVDSPKQLAEAYYQIVSAGYDGAKGLTLLEQASKAATAGVTDTQTAADGLTTVMNAYKLSIDDASEISDIFFNTVKLGKTNFEQLSASISVVAPLASASGISFREIASAVATLTKQGVPTTQAMTQIRAAIIAMNESLGDGWTATNTLQEGMQQMYDMAGGSQTALRELTGRVEGMNAILAVAGPNLKGAVEDLESYEEAIGSTNDAFAIMMQDTENKWKLFSNNLKSTTEGLGRFWVELSGDIAGILNSMFETTSSVEEVATKASREFGTLQSELNSVNVSFDRKLEILKEMKTQYPEYLGYLDLDIKNEGELNTKLEEVRDTMGEINKALKLRRELSAYTTSVQKATAEKDEAEAEYQRQLDYIQKILKDAREVAEKEGIDIEIGFVTNLDEANAEILKLDKKFKSFNPFGDVSKIKNDLGDAVQVLADKYPDLIQKQESYNTAIKEQENAEFTFFDQNIKELEIFIKGVKEVKDLMPLMEGLSNEDGKELVKTEIHLRNVERAVKSLSKENLFDSSVITSMREAYAKLGEDVVKVFDEIVEKQKDALTTVVKPKKDDRTFQERLDDVEEEYNKIVELRKRGFDLEAKALQESIKDNESTFQEYLRKRLESTKVNSERVALALKLDHVDKEYFNIEKMFDTDQFITEFESMFDEVVQTGEQKIAEISNNINLNPFENAFSGGKKSGGNLMGFDFPELESIGKRTFGAMTGFVKQFGEEGYKVNRTFTEQYDNIIESAKLGLRDLTTNQLRARKEILKLAIKEQKANGSDEAGEKIKKYKQDLKDLNSEMLKSSDFLINQAIAGLRGAAELLRKFGNEDVAQILDQIAGVGEGISAIMKGDVIGGAFQIINSALTVEVEADTEKFEKAIAKLGIEIERMGRDVGDSIGVDRLKSRQELLELQIKTQGELNSAIEAEEEARKKIKLLGITIGSKGRGSGTDQEKLEQLQDDADQLEHTLVDIQRQMDELLTGTTSQSITDAIVQGFEDGKDSVVSFGETFEEIMKKAMVNALKVQFLETAVKPFFDKFAEFSDNNNDGIFDLTTAEINTLRTQFGTIVTNANQQLEAMNQILEEAGIAGGVFGQEDEKDPNSLSGAITTITEDTANVLAGTLNAIRIDTREMLEISEQSLLSLRNIDANTSYNRFLEEMADTLKNIEDNL